MSVDLIQATYADLDQVAKRFGKASSAIEKMTREVARRRMFRKWRLEGHERGSVL